MRRIWLAPALLAVAIVLQLTVIDGLHLPRGGVPDLVLVLVVALAMTDGPVPGMVTGFAAGLCLDIAPPGSPILGQYTLVFCLAGWAAGSLGRFTRRSPLRALAVAAVVIAAAEVITAALVLVLEPAQVTVAEIREFLPITIAYDLVICPFALYVVILAATTKASRGLAGTSLAGTGLLSVPARSKPAGRKHRPHQPRLDPAAARAGDGWVGGRPGRHPGSRQRAHRRTRLHPATGTAGSASGYAVRHSLPARPVRLKFSAQRRGGVIGTAVGSGQGHRRRPGHYPGLLAGAGHQLHFRGELGGSATRQPVPATLGPGRLRINFKAHGGGTIGGGHGTSWLTTPSRPSTTVPRLRLGGGRSALAPSARVAQARSVPTVHFATAPAPIARRPAATPKFRRRSGVLLSTSLAPIARRPAAAPKFRRRSGVLLSTSLAPIARRPAAAPKFRRRSGVLLSTSLAPIARRPAAAPKFRRRSGVLLSTSLAPIARRPAAAPKFRRRSGVLLSTSLAPIARRPAAAPKFRRRSGPLLPSALTTGLVAGGVLDQSTFRARRIAMGQPRLRLASRGHGQGMLGGSGQSTLRRPPARARKQPRFGYGRRSLLTFLTGRRLGGRWLARRRAGRRSGAWLIGRRTGGQL